ncbi:MAG: protein kinase, partial [Polyangiaceae bacterium]|nr:protein kinase [Polyangiaceae bacterium]
MSESPRAIGEVFAGKYRVDRVIGEGGMGIVVQAHHLELDQPVAVKFLLQEFAEGAEGAERFRREARAAAKIKSDHVVNVIDVGRLEDGHQYMVMEYLEGQDLAAELASKGKVTVPVACSYLLQAIDAVGRAHQVGIVHRDLKPANLFLSRREDGAERLKVLDFGISKSLGTNSAEELSLTKTSAWIGSPLYMAPEQMESARDVDQRADIWSLGAILYELLSGRPPYLADSLPQLCTLLVKEEPVPIGELCPEVPADLQLALMNCLKKHPEERTATLNELGECLLRHTSTRVEGYSLPTASTISPMANTALSGTANASLQPTTSASKLSAGALATEKPSPVTVQSTSSSWAQTSAQPRPKSSRLRFSLIVGTAVLGLAGATIWWSGTNEELPANTSNSLAAPTPTQKPPSEMAREETDPSG